MGEFNSSFLHFTNWVLFPAPSGSCNRGVSRGAAPGPSAPLGSGGCLRTSCLIDRGAVDDPCTIMFIQIQSLSRGNPATPLAIALLALAPFAMTQDKEAPAADPPIFIKAERVIVRPGKELTDASVLIQAGRVLAVGQDLIAPEGATILETTVLCAGFIDPWSVLGLDSDSAARTDTNILTKAADGLDPFGQSVHMAGALRAGITGLGVALGGKAAVKGQGIFVRTTKGADGGLDVLLEDAFIGATVRGSGDAFDRIGQVERLIKLLKGGAEYGLDQVEYTHELKAWQEEIAKAEAKLVKDFKKAKKSRDKEVKDAKEEGKEFKEERYKEDRKPRKPRFDQEKEAWARVADGALPLVVEAHRYVELRALLDGTKDFGRLRLVIAGATEALPLASSLVQRSIPVILWPTPLGADRPAQLKGHDLSLAGALAEKKVRVILGSGGTAGSRDLPLLASLAVGHGLEPEKALAALTTEPARALDMGDSLGKVRAGFRADLLLLDGDPLSSNTRVRWVIAGGKIAFDAEGGQ